MAAEGMVEVAGASSPTSYNFVPSRVKLSPEISIGVIVLGFLIV